MAFQPDAVMLAKLVDIAVVIGLCGNVRNAADQRVRLVFCNDRTGEDLVTAHRDGDGAGGIQRLQRIVFLRFCRTRRADIADLIHSADSGPAVNDQIADLIQSAATSPLRIVK